MNKISIETAQNVIIEHHIAGLGERIAAYLIDGLIQVAYVVVAMIILTNISLASETMMVLIIGVPYMFYHLALEVFFNGQSVGKMLMKIRVVRLDGKEVSIGSYLLRWLLRLVDITAFSGGVAIISYLAGGKGQRLGDMAAGTTVVSLKPRHEMEESYFVDVPDDYEITMPEVAILQDSDIETVKEVMHFVQRSQNDHAIQVAYKTKEALEEKMGVKTDMKAKKFFETVIRDYTFYHTENSDSWTA